VDRAVAHIDSCDKILDADAWKALDSMADLEEDDTGAIDSNAPLYV
jgi:hypothetical protein